jgi:hypothetical protein
MWWLLWWWQIVVVVVVVVAARPPVQQARVGLPPVEHLVEQLHGHGPAFVGALVHAAAQHGTARRRVQMAGAGAAAAAGAEGG